MNMEVSEDILDSDELDDNEQISKEDKRFNMAVNHLPSLMTKISIPQNELLYLYSRYKQATQGPCCTPRPGILQFEGKKKWDAWKSLGAMTKQEAQSEYVAKIQELDIHWTPEADSSGSKPGYFEHSLSDFFS